MLFNKLLVNSLFFFTVIVYSKESQDVDVIEFCNKLRNSRKLVLVSTLDGRLSALSIDNGGQEKWSVPTEPGPLLSSTIHTMELAENTHLIRIIPSLSGGLYKFDGETIEPMPVNTDSLLKSYWDGIDISGGKEIRSYAIDIENGSILYECSMNECSNWTETTYLNNDLLFLRRETQKVRAIEVQSRTERWNYSVGLHNVTVTHNGIPECNNDTDPLNVIIKAVVPKGLLYVVRNDNPKKIEWEYQFDSPIVNAWTLIGSRLTWIDLFKPARSVVKKDKTVYPTLYIGVHDEQLYIQESEPFHRTQLLFDKPRLSMKKYRLMQAFDIENKHDVIPLLTDESERNSSTALAMLYDGTEFVKGQGYYLYCAEPTGDCQPKRSRLAVFSAVFLSSIFYWKEAIVLLTITYCLIRYLIPCPNITVFSFSEIVKSVFQRFRKAPIPLSEEVEALNAARSQITAGTSFCRTSSESETSCYHSRYLDDFEPIHCLGKGGFGVVFQARHKVDDCHYAVKRITLPNKEEARERVMREVKALAKLEHQYIVRYFQAWQECPPVGWQEEQDKLWRDKTKDEYLSSEPEGVSEISLTSSASNLNNCDNRNLGIYISTSQVRTEGSDSSFIEFRNPDSDSSAEKKMTFRMIDELQSPSSQIASSERESVMEKRRKSLSRSTGTSRVYLYIQMQLCQKNSLREWLCDNLERNQNTVLHMFDQIVQAVEYVHLQGLIHRDLKPSNIFFSPDGQIKVGDFGLVTEIMEDNDLINEPKRKSFCVESRTANVGTELYMSPEQLDGKSYNYKVDIYSLGIILFELLTPFCTQMERHRALTDLRENKFPEDFHIKHEDEHKLLSSMLSTCPDKRPTTFGIKSKSPFNRFRTSDVNVPEEWHYDIPYKNNSNIIRKSSTEVV